MTPPKTSEALEAFERLLEGDYRFHRHWKSDEEKVRVALTRQSEWQTTTNELADAIESWMKPHAIEVMVDTDKLELWVKILRTLPQPPIERG